MRVFAAVCVLALAFSASSPVGAASNNPAFPAYPDAADSIKQPMSRMNFNQARQHSTASQQAYPRGPNNDGEPSNTSRASATKPKKAICVGIDCGCGSGREK